MTTVHTKYYVSRKFIILLLILAELEEVVDHRSKSTPGGVAAVAVSQGQGRGGA